MFAISQDGFRDEEYLIPRSVLEGGGAVVYVASPKGGECIGALGAKVRADYSFDEVKTRDIDAVVVVGGPGSQKHLWDNTELHRIIRDIFEGGKVVAAICMSSAVLAKAGVLNGVRATVFPTSQSISAMKSGGADYVDEDLVVDGRIITASGPSVAQGFGQEILKAIR